MKITKAKDHPRFRETIEEALADARREERDLTRCLDDISDDMAQYIEELAEYIQYLEDLLDNKNVIVLEEVDSGADVLNLLREAKQGRN